MVLLFWKTFGRENNYSNSTLRKNSESVVNYRFVETHHNIASLTGYIFRYVLTAAHCVPEAYGYEVKVTLGGY